MAHSTNYDICLDLFCGVNLRISRGVSELLNLPTLLIEGVTLLPRCHDGPLKCLLLLIHPLVHQNIGHIRVKLACWIGTHVLCCHGTGWS